MSIKSVVMRDEKTFATLYVYRELTYKLAYGRFEKEPSDVEAVFEQLKAAATELEPIQENVGEIVKSIGLYPGWEISKVETFLVPETLNTAHRGIATKDGKEVRFYVERP